MRLLHRLMSTHSVVFLSSLRWARDVSSTQLSRALAGLFCMEAPRGLLARGSGVSIRLRGLALTFAPVLGGCVLVSDYDSSFPFSDGWREGQVLQVGTHLANNPIVFDCRKKIGVGPPGQVYAEISYRSAPRRRNRQIVPIRPVDDVAAGDLVYVKMWDCVAPLAKRVVR